MPVVHTETKTITYESAEVTVNKPFVILRVDGFKLQQHLIVRLLYHQVDTNGDVDPGVLLSAQTITSETTSTTTTTHITKVWLCYKCYYCCFFILINCMICLYIYFIGNV